MEKPVWRPNNKIRLLVNGEEFFPRVNEAIRAARREVIIETFILFEDKVGKALHAAMLDAARRGVRIDLTVDGYGSPDLSEAFLGELIEAGVRIHVWDPGKPLFGMRTNLFRRMHRKIVVVDGIHAMVGGINYSHDHLRDFGPMGKQDYACEVEGPIVDDIRRFALAAIGQRRRAHPGLRGESRIPMPWAPAQAMFVSRDNDQHTNDIERHYRAALRTARRRVVIANAYFFPGYRLLRQIRNAARRGVCVQLILQGQPDKEIMRAAARTLYDYLLKAGVEIYEYCERPLHAKVALVDDKWATVGSSNLDPLSLSLNLEANVMVRSAEFNEWLNNDLQQLIRVHSQRIDVSHLPKVSAWRRLVQVMVFHFIRRFPAYAGWLPGHSPKLPSRAVVPLETPPAVPPTDLGEPMRDGPPNR